MILLKHVSKLIEMMRGMGNPFVEETIDLPWVDTRDIMDPKVVSSVHHAKRMVSSSMKHLHLMDKLRCQFLYQSLSRETI